MFKLVQMQLGDNIVPTHVLQIQLVVMVQNMEIIILILVLVKELVH